MAILVNKKNNQVILNNVRIADSSWQRFVGLMGKPFLPKGDGLLLRPCNSIHCFFMKFPIDVAFVDKDDRVLRIITAMKPGHISPIVWKSAYVIESNQNTLEQNLRVGDTVKLLQLY